MNLDIIPTADQAFRLSTAKPVKGATEDAIEIQKRSLMRLLMRDIKIVGMKAIRFVTKSYDISFLTEAERISLASDLNSKGFITNTSEDKLCIFYEDSLKQWNSQQNIIDNQ